LKGLYCKKLWRTRNFDGNREEFLGFEDLCGIPKYYSWLDFDAMRGLFASESTIEAMRGSRVKQCVLHR
jgi:hypothetical protein